jgi:hypothetical protein
MPIPKRKTYRLDFGKIFRVWHCFLFSRLAVWPTHRFVHGSAEARSRRVGFSSRMARSKRLGFSLVLARSRRIKGSSFGYQFDGRVVVLALNGNV